MTIEIHLFGLHELRCDKSMLTSAHYIEVFSFSFSNMQFFVFEGLMYFESFHSKHLSRYLVWKHGQLIRENVFIKES